MSSPEKSRRSERFAASLIRHRFRWAGLAILVLGVAGWLGLRLTPRFDLTDYLPRQHRPDPGLPYLGGADRIAVVVDSRTPIQSAEAGPLLDSLAVRLAAIPGVRRVESRLSEGVRRYLEAEIPRRILLYFEPQELDSLAHRLSRDYMERALLGRGPPIPQTPLARALGVERTDPLGVIDPVVARLQQVRGLRQVKLVDGYFAVADQRAFFLTVEPAAGPGSVAATRNLARAVMRVLDEARADPALQNQLQGKRLMALGRPVAVLEGFDAAIADLRRVLVASAILVLGLLVVFLRRLAAPLLILGTVGYGIVLTAGLAGVILGSVSVVSWIFITALIGFGDEFALYVVSHYWITPRSKGRAAALAAALRRPGPGILLGGLTSAAAFFSLVVLSYPVMVELAWLTSVGLLIVLACAFTVLPLGLSFTEPGRGAGSHSSRFRWLSRLGQVGPRQRSFVFIAWGGVVLGSLALATRLRFEPHPWKLAVRGIPVTAEFEQISRRLGASFTPFLMVSEGRTEEEALAGDRAATRALEAVKERAGIAAIISPGRWIPSPGQQRASADFIRQHEAGFSAMRFQRDFRGVVDRIPNPDTLLIRRYLPLVTRYLVPPEPVTPNQLRAAGLAEFLDRHLVQVDGRHFAISELYPYRIPWTGGVVERFTQTVAEAGGPLREVRFVGDALRGATHAGVLRRDLLRATAVGVTLILIVLLARFRRPRLIGLCFVPMLCGVSVVLGLMGLLGIELNILTIAVAPLLVGLGADDGIHVMDRLERGEPAGEVLADTGPPMFITTLTTAAAFASLGFARFPGVAEMGLVTAVGLLVCLAASMQLVPALYSRGAGPAFPAAEAGAPRGRERPS